MFLVVFLEKVYICFRIVIKLIVRKKPKFPEPALIDSFCDMTLCMVFKKYHVLVNIF